MSDRKNKELTKTLTEDPHKLQLCPMSFPRMDHGDKEMEGA